MFVPSPSADAIPPSAIGAGGRASPFAGLPLGHFEAVLAGPPWRFATYSDKGRGRAPGYRETTLDEIAALPVGSLIRPDSALFLWSLWTMLPQAPAVIEAWGFAFKTGAFVWSTTDRRLGMGYW